MITELKGFVDRKAGTEILERIFQLKDLWFERSCSRASQYRNSTWYTLGAATYLDLQTKEAVPEYQKRTEYFNEVMANEFSQFILGFERDLACHLKTEVKLLAREYMFAPVPGFHIFAPTKTTEYFFGRFHTDIQYKGLFQLPDFPFKLEEVAAHSSYTIPLKLPYAGGGMWLKENGKKSFYEYHERSLYYHDGTMTHAIAEAKRPVLPCDWRVTLQAHGFKVRNCIYLYW